MSLNLKWIKKRERNSDYQYIVLRKNFRIIKTLVTIHRTSTDGIFKNNYRNCKLVMLNMFEILVIITTFVHIKFPFWFIKFIRPFFTYPCIRPLFTDNMKLLQSLTLYSAVYQCHEFAVRKKKNFKKLGFSSRFFLRLWLNILHNKSKITTNVKLYKKTI